MALHKKHRVVIALGYDNEVYSFVFPLEEMWSAIDMTGL